MLTDDDQDYSRSLVTCAEIRWNDLGHIPGFGATYRHEYVLSWLSITSQSICFRPGPNTDTLTFPFDDPVASTKKSAAWFAITPSGSRPGPQARHFEASVIFCLMGAPGFTLASGKYETYVITLSSSTFGFVISSGVIIWNEKSRICARLFPFLSKLRKGKAMVADERRNNGTKKKVKG